MPLTTNPGYIIDLMVSFLVLLNPRRIGCHRYHVFTPSPLVRPPNISQQSRRLSATQSDRTAAAKHQTADLEKAIEQLRRGNLRMQSQQKELEKPTEAEPLEVV